MLLDESSYFIGELTSTDVTNDVWEVDATDVDASGGETVVKTGSILIEMGKENIF